MGKWWNVNNDGILTIYADTYIKEKGKSVLPPAVWLPWLKSYNKSDITKIEFIGEGLAFRANASCWFNGYSNVTEIIGLELVSTSNVTTMRAMFWNMESLRKLDLSNFDTSKVRDMYDMFRNTKSLTELDVSNFDISKVKNMEGIFRQTPAKVKLWDM